MRARVLTTFMFLVLSLGVATATAIAYEPTVTEFSTGLTINSGPWGITEGPGDKLWFTENTVGAIGSLTADSNVFEELSGLPIVGDARGIAEGPDGNLWVAQAAGSGKIARITPTGTVTEFHAHEDPAQSTFPVDITAGPDGNLWYVSQSPELVGRITPAGVVTTFTLGITPNSDLSSITVGPDGNLWFTESADPGRIGRITTAGAVAEYGAGLTPNMAPSDITAGPDGKLWFTEKADPGGIGRISTSGVITEFSDGLTSGSQPRSIAQATDGALWFTESASPGAIGRITTSGAITEHTTGLTPGSSPWDITQGPDGNMWFTGNADPGFVGRITVPPDVKTHNAQFVDEASASLRAKIGANAQDTTYHFEYGPTEALGTQTADEPAGSDWKAVAFDTQLAELAPGTTYFYRAVATNSAGTSTGIVRSFRTKAIVSGGNGSDKPAGAKDKMPEFAKRVVAAAHAGTIRFKPPGGRWRRLPISGAEVPVGATVDARDGSVALTTAARDGDTQTGSFGGGLFSIHQRLTARGRVDLRLRGGDFSRCRRAARASSHTSPLASRVAGASRVRRVRRLWGSDRGGRFRTHGRHSHATVRGTRWLTEDRCGGTFTRVTNGAVVVRDLVRGRSVLVRAGRSYFAPKRAQVAGRRH